jgi:NAD(P)-dependent dehydrogenase (short-subunit alcohol dehydrogenase family)
MRLIWVACRSKARALPVVKEIIEVTKNPSVEFMELDLCDYNSIKTFVDAFLKRNLQLDMLINNAGIFYIHASMLEASIPLFTKNNLPIQFVANYLGHFHLTLMLYEKIKKDNTKIINVTSSLHKLGFFNLKFKLTL